MKQTIDGTSTDALETVRDDVSGAPTAGTAAAWFARHRATLDGALRAIRARTYWSAYPEAPSGKIYGETARADGEVAFRALLNRPFPLDQPGTAGLVGEERSPYGFALGIAYPRIDVDATIAAARAAVPGWRDAGVEARTGAVLEILARLNRRSFEMANAVMHTSGQGFVMAFQAGGPHAQERALEAVAYAYAEMSAVPSEAVWEKPQGKAPPVRLMKRFRIVPRGIGLVIGCATFPNWNSYPGLFASLVTGNAVIVKPHPQAILPLGLTVQIARDALREAGFDPNLVQLAADTLADPLTKTLALRPEIGIIDYTGSSHFGAWLEEHARHAQLYTEKAGVNSVIVDSTDDLGAMVRNIAFSISLYSGQMCTAPQNVFVPRSGIVADGGERIAFATVIERLAGAIRELTANDEQAADLLGAIQSDATLRRIEENAAGGAGIVVLESRAITHPRFPEARVRTPLLIELDEEGDERRHCGEQFGPIAFVIGTASTDESIARAMALARTNGAITGLIYSTDPKVLERAEIAAAEAGVALSENLVGNVFVNQSAAFSDYHVSGANPAGNAALTDAQFVAGRFRIVQSRAPVPAAGA